MKNKKVVVFDLDDTLYKEIEYLQSAFYQISKKVDSKNLNLYDEMLSKFYAGKDVFQYVIENYPKLSKKHLMYLYRTHIPKIFLSQDVAYILNYFKNKEYTLALVTDGRSITQRNKLRALKIESLFDMIVISEEFGYEKPNPKNFKIIQANYEGPYYYIGDNTSKDFLSPNKLGWTTICLLDNGQNIHKQNFNLDKEYLPTFKVKSLKELAPLIE